jgi:adenosine deaminase
MATVQGHRHPPGGIQNESDLHFVLKMYLKDCIEQNIFYTEVQQNIKIAHQIYPQLDPKQARQKLYSFFERIVEEYKAGGVYLRFLHCFNKTQTASINQTTKERSIEAANWLRETQQFAKNVFVGIEAAGHEKDENGWPIYLKEGYEAVRALGLGCEAHGGEGIGFEHMLDVARILPVTRIAHGFQIIENEVAIEEIKQRKITLVMSPIINLVLGACISSTRNGRKYKKYINNISDHPFFTLLRKYRMNLTLCSDNPQMAGVTIQTLIKILAGISDDYPFNYKTKPMTTDELIICLLNGIEAAFCEESIKQEYIHQLAQWCTKRLD